MDIVDDVNIQTQILMEVIAAECAMKSGCYDYAYDILDNVEKSYSKHIRNRTLNRIIRIRGILDRVK